MIIKILKSGVPLLLKMFSRVGLRRRPSLTTAEIEKSRQWQKITASRVRGQLVMNFDGDYLTGVPCVSHM